MGDYQRAANVKASPDALFNYLADIRNLPKYFNRMTSANASDPDEVHVTADVHGKQVEGVAKFHVDHAAKKLHWSSEGPNNYHGELSVTGQGDTSEVNVTIHTSRVEGKEIEDGIQRTLDNIVRLVQQDHSQAA